MRFPPSPPRFTRRHTLIGKFVAGESETGPFDCLIDVSQTGTHRIIGYVLGNHHTSKELEKTYGFKGEWRFVANDGSTQWEATGVFLNETASFGPHGEEFPGGLSGVVGQFECMTFVECHSHSRPRKPETPRLLSFLLHGPRMYWFNWVMEQKSFTGAVRVEQHHIRMNLGKLPFTVKPRTRYVHDNDADENPYEENRSRRRRSSPGMRETVQTVDLATRLPASDYSDEAFRTDAQSVVEDLSLGLIRFSGQVG
jgi:hypothetical protein